MNIKRLFITLLSVVVLGGSVLAQESAEVAGEQVIKEEKLSIDKSINKVFKPISDTLLKFIFSGPELESLTGEPLKDRSGGNMSLPLILIWLVGTSLLLTVIFNFVNVSHLKLAFNTVRGKYSKKSDPGEITHFQALSAALSGTVGLGNISGVAIAISVGGAGAIFWMIFAGLLGMTAKFCECTLGVYYRKEDSRGRIRGGAMYYLRDGLAEKGMAGVGKVLAVLFAIVCVAASFGAGNMYQVQQAASIYNKITESQEHINAKKHLNAEEKKKEEFTTMVSALNSQIQESSTLRAKLKEFASSYSDYQTSTLEEQLQISEERVAVLATQVGDSEGALKAIDAQITLYSEEVELTRGFFAQHKWLFGLVVAVVVGLVVIGGIKSIAKVTGFLVPIMCGVYILAALTVLVIFVAEIPAAIGTIFSSAFGVNAVAGGMIGAFIQGIRRSAFSNEAGFGSAPIAHAAVKTKYSASEGLVALLEPFVDTVIVCTMTGLVIVVTGMHEVTGLTGINLTSEAFGKGVGFFPVVLAVAAILFAVSTMFSWCYYGQQAWAFIFGDSKPAEMVFKLLFCLLIIVGASLGLGVVLDFSDAMFFFMCLFNLIGVWVLYPIVKKELAKFKKHAAEIDKL